MIAKSGNCQASSDCFDGQAAEARQQRIQISEFYTNLVGLVYEKSPSSSSLKYTLTYSNPFARSRDGHFKRADLVRSIWTILMLYASIKLIAFGITQYEHDLLADKVSAQVEEGSRRTEYCVANGSNIYFPNELDHQRLMQLKDRSRSMFVPNLALNGYSSFVCISVGFGVLVCCLSGRFFLHSRELVADHLELIYEPENLYRRLEAHKERLLKELSNSLIKRSNLFGWTCDNSILRRKFTYNRFYQPQGKITGELERIAIDTIGHKIRPAICDQKLLCDLNDWMSTLNKFFVYFLLVPALMAHLTTSIWDLIIRTDIRLKRCECDRWSPGARSIDEYMNKLTAMAEGSADALAYLNYDGTFWAKIKLALLVEFKYTYSAGVIGSHLVLVCGYFSSTAMLCFHSFHYFSSYLVRSRWFDQVDKQIDQYLESIKRSLCATSQDTTSGSPGDGMDRQIESLAIAYLNYDLFRVHHLDYNRLVNYILCQTVILIVASFGPVYWINSSLKPTAVSQIILPFTLYAALGLNVLLITCARQSKRLLNMVKKISSLVAFGADPAINDRLEPIMKFWHKQLLDKRQAEHSLTPQLFIARVTYQRILTMNSYFVLLSYLLYRKIDRPLV